MKLRCLIGIHKLKQVVFKDKNFKDEKHGWIEQDVCVFCGYKTRIMEYY